MSKLAVLVTCYNQAQIITKTIDSLEHQSLDSSLYHIYVSDDQSSDNSLEVLHSLAKQYDNITILKNEDKKFVGANRNNLISHFTQEYAIFVDGDDQQEYNFLETIYSQLDDHDVYYFTKFIEKWNNQDIVKNALGYDNFMFKAYRKNLLKQMRVNEDIKIGEDVEFSFRYYDMLHSNSKIIEATYSLNRQDDNISLTKNSDILQRYELETKLYDLIKNYQQPELIIKINNKKVELIQLAVLSHKPIPTLDVDMKKLSTKFLFSYICFKVCDKFHLLKLYYKLLDYKIGYKI